MRICYTQSIEAPIEEVFDAVDNQQKMKRWMHGLEETRFPDGFDRRNPLGTRFIGKIREGGRLQEYEGKLPRTTSHATLGLGFITERFRWMWITA